MTAALLHIPGLAVAVLVALLLLVAGIDKLRHRGLLPGVIANYRLLPNGLVAPAALLLPVVELAVAAGLLLGLLAPSLLLLAVPAAAGLLLLFAGAMAINIGRGRRHIDCGCGLAALRQQLGWGAVIRNLLLALALLPLLATPPDGLSGGELGLAAVSGAFAWLLLQLFETLKGLGTTAPGRVRG